MAGENTVSTLNGLFKVVYADKLLDLVPDFAVLQKRIEFVGAEKETGAYYAQPVNLSQEQGFTYGGTAGSAFALNSAVNGTMKEAQVYGSELYLRSQISLGALSRASKAGAKAFKRASAWKVEDMNNSMRKRVELSMLYGQSGIGTVLTNTSGALVLTEASWAGGIWAGLEGAYIEGWSTASTGATQHGQTTGMLIESVDADTRTVQVTAAHAAAGTPVAAGTVLYFNGAREASTYSEMAGLHKIITNNTSLFGIDASAFSLWKGSTYSSTGQLTHAKLQDALSRAVNKGLMEKVLILVSPKAWSVLASDLAALRVLDGSYSAGKGTQGFEALQFHSTNGVCEIVSHPFVKDGDAFALPIDSIMRIGSSDLSFGVPGMAEEFFQLVPGYAAVELGCYADQAIFVERPAHALYMSGITYA